MKKLTKILLLTAGTFFVLGLILFIAGILGGGKIKNISIINGREYNYTSFHEEFSGETIHSLDLEVSAGNLIVKQGDTFSIQGSNVIEDSIKYGVKDNELYVKEKDNDFWSFIGRIGFFFESNDTVITVTIPADFVATNTSLEVNAGELNIDQLNTKVLDLDVQAGKANLNQVTVGEKAKMELGAGGIFANDYNGKNLELDISAGEAELRGEFYETLDLDCSAGTIRVYTQLNEDEYSYDLNQSAGSIKVNGNSYKDYEDRNSAASNHIVVDCSAGTIKIETE